MCSFSYVIQDPMGIHARPAGLLAKAATAYPCSISITAPAGTADAKRLMFHYAPCRQGGNGDHHYL